MYSWLAAFWLSCCQILIYIGEREEEEEEEEGWEGQRESRDGREAERQRVEDADIAAAYYNRWILENRG